VPYGSSSNTSTNYPSQWKAICSIAEKSDLNRETLRQWVRQAERDEGRRPGLSTVPHFQAGDESLGCADEP